VLLGGRVPRAEARRRGSVSLCQRVVASAVEQRVPCGTPRKESKRCGRRLRGGDEAGEGAHVDAPRLGHAARVHLPLERRIHRRLRTEAVDENMLD